MSPSAVDVVGPGEELLRQPIEELRTERSLGLQLLDFLEVFPELFVNISSLGQDACRILRPQLVDSGQHSHETGALSVLGWEIGSPEKRLQVRGQKHVERPAPSFPKHRLKTRHVDLVHIGPFFPVKFHADEVLIEKFRYLFILERLPLHHVAPVTGRIADAQQNHLVVLAGLFKSLFSPGIPIHRIKSVLEEVRGFGIDQPVRLAVFRAKFCRLGPPRRHSKCQEASYSQFHEATLSASTPGAMREWGPS